MPGRTPTLAAIRRRLRELGDPADAEFLQRFFKTGPGQYGEGDRFLGIRVPAVRALARGLRGLPLKTIDALLHEPWHEARLLAVILLADAYKRGDKTECDALYALYMRSTACINNWDLVDSSAEHVVGPHLAGKERRRVLGRLARSKLVWDRRIALLATFHYIRRGEFADTLELAQSLLGDSHDLIHKAAGWMLREVGNRDARTLETFLDAHAHEMPRTMLRYAIEKLPPPARRRYMSATAEAV
jgi:3-methyladenine DNA glycosylase AlkD